jgi:hypothetical protein
MSRKKHDKTSPNHCSGIELGLQKYSVVSTIPEFALRYAQLFLVLGYKMKMYLRALLTRTVLVCYAQEKQDALAALWDTPLRLESEL